MNLSLEQQLAFDEFNSGNSIFITGPGGSGKTELIRQIFKSTKRRIQVCALTGCAAILLECKAKTIHSWAGIGIANGTVEEVVAKCTSNRFKMSQWTKTDVLIIDEVSMMSNEEKNTILGFYRSSKLIFCGDINYQLPFVLAHKKGVHTTFRMEGFDNIMKFDVDYRAKCSTLQNLKTHIRCCIDAGEMYVSNTLMHQFQMVDNTYVYDNYKIDDMILCNSNKKKDVYSDQFKHMEKYYITKSGQKYSCGEIIIGKPETTDCQIRHAYTVHSIQGETCRTNLYIEATGMDMRMFYTAISRACYMNQIFLIR